eukprot:scaffold39221_cov19-Cyclotella_meneghiniana.AAC.1
MKILFLLTSPFSLLTRPRPRRPTPQFFSTSSSTTTSFLSTMANGSVESDSNNPNEAADSLQPPHPEPPLYQSPRLKGYIALLSSAVYNYISAKDQTLSLEDQPVDWCLAQYDLGMLLEDPRPDMSRLRYAMAAAVITIMITCVVIFIHLISITGLGNKLWSK